MIEPLAEGRLPARSDANALLSASDTDSDSHPTTAVDIRVAAGESPSPQTAKSASVFTGLCLVDVTSIQMVRAPVGADGANDDEVVAVGGSHSVAGRVVTTNRTCKPL